MSRSSMSSQARKMTVGRVAGQPVKGAPERETDGREKEEGKHRLLFAAVRLLLHRFIACKTRVYGYLYSALYASHAWYDGGGTRSMRIYACDLPVRGRLRSGFEGAHICICTEEERKRKKCGIRIALREKKRVCDLQ